MGNETLAGQRPLHSNASLDTSWTMRHADRITQYTATTKESLKVGGMGEVTVRPSTMSSNGYMSAYEGA